MIRMLFSHILHIAVCNWCKRYLWPGMKLHETIWNPLHQISWICSGQAKTAIVQSVKRGEQRKATISWTEWKIEWKVKGQKWPEIPKVTARKRFETGDSQEHFPEFQLLCGMHRNLPPLSCEAAALSQNNKHIKHLQILQWIHKRNSVWCSQCSLMSWWLWSTAGSNGSRHLCQAPHTSLACCCQACNRHRQPQGARVLSETLKTSKYTNCHWYSRLWRNAPPQSR